MQRSIQQSSKTLLVALVLALLGGCASTPSLTQIAAFGDAAGSLTDSAKKGFTLAESATVDRKIYDVASDPKQGPTDDTFKSVFGGPNAEALRVRIATLDALGAYAKALSC